MGVNISKKVLDMLNLGDKEYILFHMKVSNNPIFKNGVKQARIYLFITNEKIILLDYFRFKILSKNSFREKDIVPLSNIKSIEARMKKFTLSPEPLIAMTTLSDEIYEIVFYRKKSCKEKYGEIVDIIRNINPSLESSINL